MDEWRKPFQGFQKGPNSGNLEDVGLVAGLVDLFRDLSVLSGSPSTLRLMRAGKPQAGGSRSPSCPCKGKPREVRTEGYIIRKDSLGRIWARKLEDSKKDGSPQFIPFRDLMIGLKELKSGMDSLILRLESLKTLLVTLRWLKSTNVLSGKDAERQFLQVDSKDGLVLKGIIEELCRMWSAKNEPS